MNFAWKYLVPLSIINILIAGVWYEMVIRPGYLTFTNWIWGFAVTGVLVVLSVYLVFLVNRKASARVALGSEWPSLGQSRTGAPIGQAAR
jgi:NADH-quinone oxidoreductase subunit H